MKYCEVVSSITRVEVIDSNGRVYTRYLSPSEILKYSLQDDSRTLKIFIEEEFGDSRE